MTNFADRVQETSITTGTGTLNLGGAVIGYQSFASAFTTGTTVYYCISDGVHWEVGSGTFTTGAPNTLSRLTVYSSSNGNALVNFVAALLSVFCTYPAYAANTITYSSTGLKTSGAITASGQIFGTQSFTTISTVGAGVLTAAALVGGVISRTGPVAGYTDTTDTATNIIAAIPNAQVGTSFKVRILNTVAFAATAPTAGTGVTITGAPYVNTMVASSYRDFIGVITNVSTPAVTFYGIGSVTL